MPLYRAFLQTLGATLLLALALACGGKKNSDVAPSTSVLVDGSVTMKRVPLAYDANGVPTGLVDASNPDNLTTVPVRGIVVRAYQQVAQTQPDGSTSQVWLMVRTATTDSLGVYSLSVVKDRPTMVEILSSFNGGNATLVNVIGEPQGIHSATTAMDRLRYALRKAVDGSAPAGTNTPASVITKDTVLNFNVGLEDTWYLVNPSFNLSTREAPLLAQATLETDQPGRTAGHGSGSRLLAIGDTIASFLATYGTATPGAILDLHYWPGRTEPEGSFVEFDTTKFPQAFDSSTSTFHLFGSLRGGPINDDAWDEGVILPLLARGVLYAGNNGRTFSVPLNPLFPPALALPDLSPDIARMEGLAQGMAANILKSPYLADTLGTGLLASVQDIRDISSLSADQRSPYSAPTVAALSWEVVLKANKLPSPGTPTEWTNLNPLASARFFLPPPSLTNGATDATARDLEPLSIYSQIKRLSEVKSGSETVDLAAIFTDAALTNLTTPFGIPWPRPSTGPLASFVADWGTDPVAAFPPVTLSMAKAVLVGGTYPNLSQGEVCYAGFSLTSDKRCALQATIFPALPAGAEISVDIPRLPRTFRFTGTGGVSPAMVLPVETAPPYYHPVRVRLLSPAAVQPDLTVTLALVPAP